MRPAGTSEITAVLHAGALGPLDESCLRRVERCDWGELCSTMSVLSIPWLRSGKSALDPLALSFLSLRGLEHMCVSLSWWAVCRSLQPLKPQAPVPGVDAFASGPAD